MTLTQQIIIIATVAAVTFATRALPFAVFRSDRPTPKYLEYLGRALPPAVFAMLVVYCLKDISPFVSPYGFPELICICVSVVVHLALRRMLISIASGTLLYLVLANVVF